MDFDFSEEQRTLREAVRDTLAGIAGASYVAAMADDDRGFTDDVWRTVSDLGWTGLLVPEEHGGLGMDLVDMVVLCEEMGKLPLPGPFFSSAAFATLAATRLGAEELLADLARGARRGTVAIDEVGSRDPLDAIDTRATRGGRGWTLDGLKPVVLDGHTADWAIVAARFDGGLGAFLVERPPAEAAPGLDATRKVARLPFRGTPARKLTDGDDTEVLRRIADDAAVLLCAELTGASERALHLAEEYAKHRVQFGRPIGSFQAIKHMAADMLQKVELCRVAGHHAAWTSATDSPERELATAMAKSWCPEAAVWVTGQSIQIHGAVGFTWECPAHHLFKRAKVNDLLLGQQGWQRQRVADLVLGPAGA